MTLQERLGLTRAVFVQASCHGTDNSAMVDAIERGQGRYAGVAMIDESFSDAEIRRAPRRRRCGAPDSTSSRTSAGRPTSTCSGASSTGWHRSAGTSCCTSTPSDLPQYAGLLDRMPCPYVIDHMARVPVVGGIDQEPFQALLALLG